MSDKYKVILADPPWDQKAGRKLEGYKTENGKQIFNPKSNLSEPLPYPTMTMQDILNLPIQNIADENSVLFLWITNKYLPKIETILTAWGFKYSATIVWAKNKLGGGLGGNVRITTEFLIYATKGKPKCKVPIESSWHNVKRDYVGGYPKHSKKPKYFIDLIEQSFDGPYIELFARENRTGWSAFGNEIENSIELYK